MGETQRAPLTIYIPFVIAFSTIQGNTFQPIDDPCNSSETRELPFLRQRVVGYKLADGENPICDQYFYKGWYKMYDNVIASTDGNCGTDINWYRKDALPEEIGKEKNMNYCLNTGNGECGLEETGKVIKCSDEKYVFKLLPLPGCPQAYCIEKLNNTNGTTT
ncbi:uncharacterized protein LOC132759382, partial [Ruditapes philippinarum]|uniref:uncharacterized protein LOC132759382 n=1 Tax=Ruditapes philippinarum TaxID=129788 RepID=UPI00295C2EE2